MNRHGELTETDTYYVVLWKDPLLSRDEYTNPDDVCYDVEKALSRGYGVYDYSINVMDVDDGFQEKYTDVNEFKKDFGDWL